MLAAMALAALSLPCLAARPHATAPKPAPLGAAPSARLTFKDFGAPENTRVLHRLQQTPARAFFHYVQIGDSHTAGDYLTDALRVRLQGTLGDGGLGWAMPMWVKGQRLARIGYDQTGWNLTSSRTTYPQDYPFGGFIAQADSPEAQLTVKAKQDAAPRQHVVALVKQENADEPLTILDSTGEIRQIPISRHGVWTSVEFSATLPFTVLPQNAASSPQIGGWWLRGDRPGAIVSAAGINGAQLQHLARWRPDWISDLALAKPDLVALSFGTNESLDTDLDADTFRATLESTIDSLRGELPGVAILVIGAPESLSRKAGVCGVRTPLLDTVQRVQRQVAAAKHTLYWDWQQAMGGPCSMMKWMRAGLARKDGVHFTADGYSRAGENLFEGLMGK